MSLNHDEIRALLEQRDENGNLVHQDLLTGEAKKEQAFFRANACPSCRGMSTEPFVNPHQPFTPGNPLPNKLLRCLMCKTEFNPYTGLVTLAPTPESN